MPLKPPQARAFYDRWGRRQDWQRFYEDPAIDEMVQHGAFDVAEAVVEFGCGTGRLAERLLAHRMPDPATYLGVDVSTTMVELARRRLRRFGSRVRVLHTDGSPTLPEPAASCDRFVATYVLDLLEAEDIVAVIAEAHRLLVANGRLCLVSLTHGSTRAARLVERLWNRVHAWRPQWVGGCRPLALHEFVGRGWTVVHDAVRTRFAVSSEVLVAVKRAPAPLKMRRLRAQDLLGRADAVTDTVEAPATRGPRRQLDPVVRGGHRTEPEVS